MVRLFVVTLLLTWTAACATAIEEPSPISLWVRRNVKDLGAVGDGVHDDTAAFILALTQEKATVNASLVDPNAPWNASQYNCQTTKPSIVVVPPGVYRITATLPLTFYTQLVGRNYTSASDRPVLKFEGYGYHCLDAGIDEGAGNGWFGNVNQNNFYHQVRNVIVNLEDCTSCVGIHWEVSQATNLVNVDVVLGDANVQGNTGVLMECGSGGYFGDVAVYGGKIGMAIGNQQFTLRNVSIVGAETAVYMYWNWVWAIHDVYISNSTYGFVLTNSVRSISLVDVVVEHTTFGVYCNDTPPALVSSSLSSSLLLLAVQKRSERSSSNKIATTEFLPIQLLLDAVNMSNDVQVPLTINGSVRVTDASEVYQYTYARLRNGSFYAGSLLGSAAFPARPRGLLMPGGQKWFGMTRPDYNPDDSTEVFTLNLDNFTDVTAELQAALNSCVKTQMVIFVPFGTYFISDTVVLPTGTRMFGEVWTRFAPIGAAFANASTPRAMFQVGVPGDVGVAQLADLMLTNHGPAPGAILLSWYTAGSNPGDAGVWDVHYRIGGAMDTATNVTLCNVNVTYAAAPECSGVHTMFHIQPNASVYVENMWGWTADHHIDLGNSLNMFNARGLVVETTNPVWLYGTAMEHSFLFQYNLVDSRQTLLSIIQTETAYYQPQFKLVKETSSDPLFPLWQWHGFSIVAQRVGGDTVLYGAGMYSFFYHWSTSKCGTDPLYCQTQISSWTFDQWSGGKATTRLHNFNTHAAKYVVQWDLVETPAINATNGFCDTVSIWNGV